ncbi:MAG: tRNA uridine-5-carboxymethylaminomethyl(34) synthesis GTPase MnmE, partial [Peptococcaceae bacterium]|nr:tRNA uridine-5-carboxymethylaminomethyl(34) synthesis GTPase MnmE [Peptococcaceae bacterium]
MSVTDTIAAIITAPGRAAVGIIRLSGPEAVAIAGRLYDGAADLSTAASHTIHYGWVWDQAHGKRVDEALFLLMRGPKSYTGEDVVEIQCHGGHTSTQEILRLCLVQGARVADEGEFTKRAFINGKLDLTRAEAVMDIVDAKSEAALSQAVAQKSGVLEGRIRDAREAVLELVAFIQADLDYPEDDIERLTDAELASRVQAVAGDLDALIASAERGRITRDGIKMV